MEVSSQNSKISIKELNLLEELELILESIVQIYKEVYGEAPSFQVWEEDFIRDLFHKYFKTGKIFIAFDDTRVIGFAAIINFIDSSAYTLSAKFENKEINIDEFLKSKYNLDAKDALYLADIGTDSAYRKIGLGSDLLNYCVKSAGDKKVVNRASVVKEQVIAFYKKRGFESMELYQSPVYKYSDGTQSIEEKLLFISSKN